MIIGDDMDIKREKKVINKEEIVVKNVDIRNFYVDDHATCIDDASDCIHLERISFEKFQQLKTNPIYKNLEYVTPREYSTEYK